MTAHSWTSDDDEVALDGIIVGIESNETFTAARINYGEVLGSIYWPDWISQGDKVNAALESLYSVPDASERAQTLCGLWAFNRVAIAIQGRANWRREWGELREHGGLD